MSTQLATSLVIIFLLITTACQSESNTTNQQEEKPAVEKISASNPTDILSAQIMNIQTNAPISFIDMALEKGILSTGEGDFDVFYITSEEGKQVGYIIPNPEDEKLVGDVCITANEFVLPNGLHVGATWADIQEKVSNQVTVHGSEIEQRAYADLGEYQLLLDIPFNTYEVDESQIPATTKVTEIRIRK